MPKERIPERKKLAAVFASFSILVVGAVSLSESMSLDYYSVLNTLQKVIPASVVLGGLGWVMGMVLDKPKKSRSTGYNSTFFNRVIKNEMTSQDSPNNEETTPGNN